MAGYLGNKPAVSALNTTDLNDGIVTAAKIADGTIVAAEIAADAIDGTKLADNAVDSEHYTDGSIDAAHLAANSVDSASYVDGSIDAAHLAANSVDSDAYVDGSIDLAHLSADSVDGTKIADNAIDSEHYTDGSIDNIHTNFQPGTTFKGDGSSASGKIIFNCEQNSHAVSIQAPAHSAGATYTLTLPTSDGAANEVLQTNGSGVLTWVPLGTILDGSPDTDHTANGPQTNTYASGYSSTIMDLVYMGSSSKWLEADSDATGTSINLLGIALEAKTDTQAMNVALPGSFVRDDSWNWTPGVPLYVDTTLGAITATKPTGSGDVVRTVGFAVHADYIFFNPSSDYMTLA